MKINENLNGQWHACLARIGISVAGAGPCGGRIWILILGHAVLYNLINAIPGEQGLSRLREGMEVH